MAVATAWSLPCNSHRTGSDEAKAKGLQPQRPVSNALKYDRSTTQKEKEEEMKRRKRKTNKPGDFPSPTWENRPPSPFFQESCRAVLSPQQPAGSRLWNVLFPLGNPGPPPAAQQAAWKEDVLASLEQESRSKSLIYSFSQQIFICLSLCARHWGKSNKQNIPIELHTGRGRYRRRKYFSQIGMVENQLR